MRFTCWSALCRITLLLALAEFAFGTAITVLPTSSSTAGSPVALDVAVSDVTDLFAYQFDVLFDPAALSAIGVTEGPFLSAGGFTFFDPGIIDNSFGSVSLIFNTLLGPGPGVSGSGVMASVSFSPVGLGVSPVDLSGLLLLDSSLSDISADMAGAEVRVDTLIPEPSTMALIGVGLLCLAVVRQHRPRRHKP